MINAFKRQWIERGEPFETPWRRATSPLELVDYGVAGAWQCNLADDSLTWCAAVFDLFGFPPSERIDRRETLAMYAPESRALLERLRADAIARRASFTFEAQIQRTDGEMRWMRVMADVACRDGKPTHLYGLKEDITAEMRA